MLTFLVLLPLHVATLHRCLVVLLRCIHEGVGWGFGVNVPCTSSATPLHVATLHRCLVVLLRCMHEGVGWGGMLTKSKLSSPLCDAGSAGDM